MLKIEKTVLPSPEQWEIIIEGMRNPMNSWDKMDSFIGCECSSCEDCDESDYYDCREFNADIMLGPNDHRLMMKLANGGSTHAKYRRMIPVWITINAPLYWWKEFDTYKVGTVCNSCSTMHKIHAKEFELDDFSCEKLQIQSVGSLAYIMDVINYWRNEFNNATDPKYKKSCFEQMIQLLPTSYNQKRTIFLNYEVLVGMYRDRRNHKLDEWHTFCDWIKTLPYSEIITGVHDSE